MGRKLAALALGVGAVLALAMASRGVQAQTPLAITAGVVDNNFPDGMTFHAHAESPTTITDIRLKYEILPDGTAATAKADFAPGTSADVEVPLMTYLPPGTIINYHWEVTANGQKSASPQQSFFYDDVRFQWKKLEADDLTIYHYGGSEVDAQQLHDVGVRALADAETLLDVQVPFGVNVWIYDTADDMRPALPRTSPTFESQIITLGVRISSDTVLVLGGVSYDTLRHELTHIVTAQAGDSALGSLPSWLDEGTAVHAQQEQGGFGDAIQGAIQDGKVLSVREISSAAGEPGKVELFYGESWSLVSFLIDSYGQPKFGGLFSLIKAGNTLDQALETTYSFDQDGLENAWRAEKGLPPRVTPVPTSAPQQTAAPSLQPPDDSGTSTSTLIAIAAGVLLLAAAVGFAGITLGRRLG